ncbi:hypothetical protein PORY_001073 [Pneumocystis oryctolagi]|uniref:Uncharacterized protein n=1 Tax=Pneumocystis oryctolagi TaxID=42067 RepID=A0ACB7CG46_9ASCO|nr:hypothetical protein PORY_001073 [Pneumocystis oryctolagi]
MERCLAVVGATGTGKSRLAAALAAALGGEVVNSDALQVYRGAEVLTNKGCVRGDVVHHLVGTVGWEEGYDVQRYEREALGVVGRLQRAGRLPVVAGGTHYYTQAILFENTLLDGGGAAGGAARSARSAGSALASLESLSTAALYARLNQVDPVIAQRWHPHDRRRIARSLEIFLSTGQRPSDLYQAQRQTEPSTRSGDRCQQAFCAHPRFKTCVFWVYRELDVLDQFLDQRVEEMCASGALDDLHMLYSEWNARKQQQREDTVQESLEFKTKQGRSINNNCISENVESKDPDSFRGIWQAIGFKAFLPYLELPEDTIPSVKHAYFMRSIAAMQLSTRQYARKQIKWIRNKLYPLCLSSGPDIRFYLLDATNLSDWETRVQNLAITLATGYFLHDRQGPDPLSLSETAMRLLTSKPVLNYASQTELWKHYVCDVCKTSSGEPFIAIGLPQWMTHVQGRRHRTRLARHKQQE